MRPERLSSARSLLRLPHSSRWLPWLRVRKRTTPPTLRPPAMTPAHRSPPSRTAFTVATSDPAFPPYVIKNDPDERQRLRGSHRLCGGR